jgi:hypothetical protein
MSDVAGLLVGFVLTLFIFSYIVRDNALYRLAVHILLGVTSAYAVVVVVRRVFTPIVQQVINDPLSAESLLWLIPLLLTALLLLRLIRPAAWLGNGAVGALIGVGTAVGLVGAIAGTLLPQIMAPAGDGPLVMIAAALMTICTLLYFQFTGPADEHGNVVMAPWRRAISLIGRGVLALTFGALFAGLLSTSLAVLVERVDYYLSGLLSLFGA